jgi:cation transport ATPase
VLEAAKGDLPEATEVSEPPGAGLRGTVAGRRVEVTGRKLFAAAHPGPDGDLPPAAGAVLQEVIDVAVVVNALRAAPPRALTDY